MPTVTICSEPFVAAAREEARVEGIHAFPVVKVAHPMATAAAADIRAQIAAALPHIAEAVSQPPAAAPRWGVAQGTAGEDGVRGTFEEINEVFYQRGWTDGLPIVPPFGDKVSAMLAGSPGAVDEVVGSLPPAQRPVTKTMVAVNAVMAGCLPAYFPVVWAAVLALLDERSNLFSIQTATNATTPLVIVNGPIRRELDLNSGINLFGPGWRANATIGRAIRLVLLNLGGGVPGVTDMSTHGQPGKYSFCIAEAEEASPWEPLHAEHGFAGTASTVTLIGAGAPHNIFAYRCPTARDLLTMIVSELSALGHNNMLFDTGPVLVLSPEHAALLARDGFTKAALKRHLFEKARVPLRRFPPGTRQALRERRARWFATAGDPAHVGVADRPEDFLVIVAGGPGIHSQFLPTAFSRGPVIRAV